MEHLLHELVLGESGVELVDDVARFAPVFPDARLIVHHHKRRVGDGVVQHDQLGEQRPEYLCADKTRQESRLVAFQRGKTV